MGIWWACSMFKCTCFSQIDWCMRKVGYYADDVVAHIQTLKKRKGFTFHKFDAQQT